MTKCEIILLKVGMKELLEKYGIYPFRNRQYRCPFHGEDKHPSSSVKDNKWFHCYACGVNINVIDFVAKKENCSRSKAISIINELFKLGFNKELTQQEKYEIEQAKLKNEREEKRKQWWKSFMNQKLNQISSQIRLWEQVQKDTHPTRGEIKTDSWEFKNTFFASLKQQEWLNWLHDRLLGKENFELSQYDYIYGSDRKELWLKLYRGELNVNLGLGEQL